MEVSEKWTKQHWPVSSLGNQSLNTRITKNSVGKVGWCEMGTVYPNTSRSHLTQQELSLSGRKLDGVTVRLCDTIGRSLEESNELCGSKPHRQWLFETLVEECLDELQALQAHCLPTWVFSWLSQMQTTRLSPMC